jgi:hypothetical protein
MPTATVPRLTAVAIAGQKQQHCLQPEIFIKVKIIEINILAGINMLLVYNPNLN